MESRSVRIRKLAPNAVTPTYGSPSAAGADLYALADSPIRFAPGETILVRTGIAMEIPEGCAGFVFARSGMASKRGLAPANKVGVIDSDYRGEILVALHNHSREEQTVEPGERVAQIVIAPVLRAEFTLCDSLSETERASGGFGSTGRN